jgi:hypothetical protein
VAARDSADRSSPLRSSLCSLARLAAERIIVETYKVLAPTGLTRPASAEVPPLGDLNGKVIIELWDYLFEGDVMLDLINTELRERFPDIRIIDYQVVGNIHGTDEAEVASGLPAILQERAVDGGIVLVAC